MSIAKESDQPQEQPDCDLLACEEACKNGYMYTHRHRCTWYQAYLMLIFEYGNVSIYIIYIYTYLHTPFFDFWIYIYIFIICIYIYIIHIIYYNRNR